MALLMCGAVLYAQDVIIKTDGSELKGKVTEVAADVIKYHRADNPEGPLYNLPKTEVFMVLYANGTRETFTQPRTETKQAPPVAAPAVSKYDSLMQLSKREKVWGYVGVCLFPVFTGAGTYFVASGVTNQNLTPVAKNTYIAVGSILLAGGVAEFIAGCISFSQSSKHAKQALQYKTTSAVITYPMPAMVQGKAPGINFRMNF